MSSIAGPNDPRVAYYAFEQNASMANGFVAPGRRAVFGLQDDSYTALSDDAKTLFRAGLLWTAGVR